MIPPHSLRRIIDLRTGDMYVSSPYGKHIFLFLGRDEKRFWSLTFGPSGKIYIDYTWLLNVDERQFRLLNDD